MVLGELYIIQQVFMRGIDNEKKSDNFYTFVKVYELKNTLLKRNYLFLLGNRVFVEVDTRR